MSMHSPKLTKIIKKSSPLDDLMTNIKAEFNVAADTTLSNLSKEIPAVESYTLTRQPVADSCFNNGPPNITSCGVSVKEEQSIPVDSGASSIVPGITNISTMLEWRILRYRKYSSTVLDSTFNMDGH